MHERGENRLYLNLQPGVGAWREIGIDMARPMLELERCL